MEEAEERLQLALAAWAFSRLDQFVEEHPGKRFPYFIDYTGQQCNCQDCLAELNRDLEVPLEGIKKGLAQHLREEKQVRAAEPLLKIEDQVWQPAAPGLGSPAPDELSLESLSNWLYFKRDNLPLAHWDQELKTLSITVGQPGQWGAFHLRLSWQSYRYNGQPGETPVSLQLLLSCLEEAYPKVDREQKRRPPPGWRPASGDLLVWTLKQLIVATREAMEDHAGGRVQVQTAVWKALSKYGLLLERMGRP